MTDEEIKILECNELVDMLHKFEEDYLKKMLIKRDEVWHKRKGDFKDATEEKLYNELNEKCAFMQNLINSCRQLISTVGVSANVMEDLITTVEKMKMIGSDGKFKNTLFKEQAAQMDRLMGRAHKIYPYVLQTCKEN